MLEALAEQLPPEATWTRPEGGLFIWATLPEGVDTTDLLAKALSRNVAFVPGRAAYLDGRGGTSMRLNFSGVTDERIREGVRRVGAVVREQVDLLGTLRGTRPPGDAAPQGKPADPAPPDPSLADVLQLPRREGDGRSGSSSGA
jgi:2-aminoadipate transaminase